MGRSRHSPIKSEIINCPMSGPAGMYFPYNPFENSYNLDSFKLEYSGGRITEQDCMNLKMELKDCPLSKLSNNSDCGVYYIFLGVFLMMISLPLYLVLCLNDQFSGKEGFIGTDLAIGIVLILVLGIATMITNCIVWGKRNETRDSVRKRVLDSIINRHNNNIFGPKQASVRMSPYRGYIFIQFLWVAQQVMPQYPRMADLF